MGGGSNFDAASVAEDIVAVLIGAEEPGHAPIGLCEAILITPVNSYRFCKRCTQLS